MTDAIDNFRALAMSWGGLIAFGRRSFVTSWCIALLLVMGCDQGPQRVPVAGKVLIDGKPLTVGTIRFVPESGRPVSANLAEDGSFRVTTKVPTGHGDEIEGLYPGKYKLAVFASENVSSAENAEVRWFAPPRYADFRTADLEASIQGPNEDMVVQLTSEGSEASQDSKEAKAIQKAQHPSDESDENKCAKGKRELTFVWAGLRIASFDFVRPHKERWNRQIA